MRVKILLSALLVGASVLVYAGVRQHRFVDLDDIMLIVENPDLRVNSPLAAVSTAFTTRSHVNWTPLTVLSLQLDHSLYGEAPAGFLLTNVALHAASAVVLFLAMARLTGGLWPSAFVAAVFALHPLHVESVAWAAQRKDVLSALFWMLTLLAYAGYAERGGPGRYAAVLLFLVLGLLAKPIVVTLPFVLLLLDYWPLRRLGASQARRRALLEKLPMLVPVAVVCVVTLSFQTEVGAVPDEVNLPWAQRAENALDAYAVYLGKTLWPTDLAVFYPHPAGSLPGWRVALAGAVVAATSTAALALARSRPYLPVGWFWYLGTLVPVIGLVQVGMQSRADRYCYLPLVGLSIAAAWGAADLLAGRRAGRAGLAAVGSGALVALAVASVGQVAVWRDAVTLHSHAVAVIPDNVMETQRLANALAQDGRHAEAIPHYERSIELEPRLPGPYFGRADAYARVDRLEAAVASYERGLELQPNHARGRANLGLALARLGRDRQARRHLERVLAEHEASGVEDAPELGAPYIALADVLTRLGDVEGAAELYERAFAADASRLRAGGNVGMELAREGRHEEAIQLLNRALEAHPHSAHLHASLAMSYAEVGHSQEAAHHYRRALALNPRWRPVANDLAWLLATSSDPELRRPEEAIRLVEEVLLENESRPEVLDTLAAAYASAGRFDEAIASADRALSLVHPGSPFAGEIRARLALYREGRPYLEPGVRGTDAG